MVPSWLALMFVLFDFGFLAVCFRYTGRLSIVQWTVSWTILFLVRLAAATGTLAWVRRRYQISGTALGIRVSKISSDFRWSFRICVRVASMIGIGLLISLIMALCLGIHLPAPPELLVQLLNGKFAIRSFIIIALGGAIATVLIPVTEELIYRSLLLPALTAKFGLFLAVAITSILFGLAHVVPFGELGIPGPQILGGFVMSAGFSIRWSVVPAMVIHAMGNLFIGIVGLLYLGLFEACPRFFLGQ